MSDDSLESLLPMEEESPLEDLFADAQIAGVKIPKRKKVADPSLRETLDAAAKKMKDLYLLPENWHRTRGIALIDQDTGTLVGNFSEYKHISTSARRLVREHTPIAIDAVERCSGYLGENLEQRLRGNTWEAEHFCRSGVLLDELMVEAPAVELKVCTRLGAICRAELVADTQFASVAGNTLLLLPAGTDVWFAMGTDCKAAVRKAAGL